MTPKLRSLTSTPKMSITSEMSIEYLTDGPLRTQVEGTIHYSRLCF